MIKNLLFDLGGVIMDIRRENCIESFRRLGMAHPEDFLGEYSQKGPFMALEEGRITPEEFRREIRAMIPHEVTDGEIDSAFCDFLVGIPRKRLEELRRLHRDYRLYLLSNTNPIMWDTRIAEEFAKEGHDISYYFDGMVTSFDARSLKPSEEIFRYACSRLGIIPSETLFFDDSQSNVEAARALGFNAIVVPPGAEFGRLLDDYLNQHNK